MAPGRAPEPILEGGASVEANSKIFNLSWNLEQKWTHHRRSPFHLSSIAIIILRNTTTTMEEQYSRVVPNTSRDDRGDIRRHRDPLTYPALGFLGCQTLYEGFRRGQATNPLGSCLGFRAVSTNGMATPYIYSSYTEVLARVDAFAAGLDTLNLVPPTDDNMVLVRFCCTCRLGTRV
jgi:hypothetical protein